MGSKVLDKYHDQLFLEDDDELTGPGEINLKQKS